MSDDSASPVMSDESRVTDEEGGGLFPLSITTTQFRIVFYLAALVYVLYLLITGWSFSWNNKLFPYLIGIPTIALTVFHIIFLSYPSLEDQLVPSGENEEASAWENFGIDTEDIGRSRGEKQKFGIMMFGWVTALPVAVYYLGYAYVLPVYVFVFVWYFRRDGRLAALLAVGFSIAAYILFIVILGMIPWGGTLGLPNPLNYLPF